MKRKFEEAFSVLGWLATGSRVIVDPPVTNTDEDFVLLVRCLPQADGELRELGYIKTGAENYTVADADPFQPYNRFVTYRHPDTDENLIVVDYAPHFVQWNVATALATKLNLTDKEDRIALFRAILSGGMVL